MYLVAACMIAPVLRFLCGFLMASHVACMQRCLSMLNMHGLCLPPGMACHATPIFKWVALNDFWLEVCCVT
jgi:hypothetical protein